jgi:hypothetical protein
MLKGYVSDGVLAAPDARLSPATASTRERQTTDVDANRCA